MTDKEIPRRIQLDKMIPAELAIHNAIQEVEKIGADVRLTNAVIKLQEAKDLISDFTDEKIVVAINTRMRLMDYDCGPL